MAAFDNPEFLFHALRLGQNEAFEFIYQKYFRSATTFVRQNSGDETDARDIFQEALVVLFKKTRQPEFQLTADVGTFLYAVVRKIWLYKLRQKRSHPEILVDDSTKWSDEISDDFGLEATENEFEEKTRAVKNEIEKLKTECQEVLESFYYQRLSMAEIAQKLGYTEGFAKVKKHRCMEFLREKLKKN